MEAVRIKFTINLYLHLPTQFFWDAVFSCLIFSKMHLCLRLWIWITSTHSACWDCGVIVFGEWKSIFGDREVWWLFWINVFTYSVFSAFMKDLFACVCCCVLAVAVLVNKLFNIDAFDPEFNKNCAFPLELLKSKRRKLRRNISK